MTPDDLHLIAGYLEGQATPASDAQARYEAMSDALVWSDELTPELAIKFPHRWSCIRFVLRARTCRVLHVAPEYSDWWERAHQLFPNWVGLRSDRFTPSVTLQELFYKQRAAAIE